MYDGNKRETMSRYSNCQKSLRALSADTLTGNVVFMALSYLELDLAYTGSCMLLNGPIA